MNSTQNWTSVCEPGWSNAGQFNYPPGVSGQCWVSIRVIDAIYVTGTILAIAGILHAGKAILELRRCYSVWGVCCITCFCFHCLDLWILRARLVLSHEDEIIGRASMKTYSAVYVSLVPLFWGVIYLYLFSYLNYLKATSSSFLSAVSKAHLKFARLLYVGAVVGASNLAVFWGLLSFKDEETHITYRGRQIIIVQSLTILLTLALWTALTKPLIKDFKHLASCNTDGDDIPAIVVIRAREYIKRLKLITVSIQNSGMLATGELIVTLAWFDFHKVFAYSVPAVVMIFSQFYMIIVVYMIRTQNNNKKMSESFKGSRNSKKVFAAASKKVVTSNKSSAR